MSIVDFIKNPASYSKGHIVQFSHQSVGTSPAAAGMACVGTMNHWSGDWQAEEYAQSAGAFTGLEFEEGFHAGTQTRSQIGSGSSKMHSVMCTVVGADLGIRFLPWKANCVTYMSLDANANRFFTGPLSGCCIYMGADAGGVPYVFHANRNNSPGQNNVAIKASMATSVITRMGSVVTINKSALPGQHYSGFGFVFGLKVGTQWEYYIGDTDYGKKGGTYTTTVTKL